MPKNLYVIAGPNGAGKTTFAREFLPHFAKCDEFVNADLIATGLSPFSPRGAALQAGRLVLKRIHELASRGMDFGFETTLAGQSYLRLFKQLRARGYRIHLIFLWLPDEDLAVDRVRSRVRMGGHDVPERDIRRRFHRGLKNFLTQYKLLVDDAILYDNAKKVPFKIATLAKGRWEIVESEQFERVTRRNRP